MGWWADGDLHPEFFYRLGRDGQGALVRNGPSGKLEYLDASQFDGRPTFQVNFFGGSIISVPVVTRHPAYVITNNNGVQEYRYVAE